MIFIKDDARVTSGAGTVCSSGAPEFAPVFSGVAQSLVFCVL